jgi:micrococcal nuclease
MRGLVPVFRRLMDNVTLGARWRRRRGEAAEQDIETIHGRVEKTVDGDTLHVRDGDDVLHKVRLLSIDTPETHFFGATQGYWGERASSRLSELLPVGHEVEVRTDEQKRDAYGRVLGYVYAGTKFINRQMLLEGLAVNYVICPNLLHAEEFAEIVKKCDHEGRGMFHDRSLEIPYEFRWSTRGKIHVRYVGSVSDHLVLPVAERGRIPVCDRVFFLERGHVRPPYRVAQDGE